MEQERPDDTSPEEKEREYGGTYGDIDSARSTLQAKNFGAALGHLIDVTNADRLIGDLQSGLDHSDPDLSTAISNWWKVERNVEGKTGRDLWREARAAQERAAISDVIKL